jgi:hypothetical protein
MLLNVVKDLIERGHKYVNCLRTMYSDVFGISDAEPSGSISKKLVKVGFGI